jgi:hypothetical protein
LFSFCKGKQAILPNLQATGGAHTQESERSQIFCTMWTRGKTHVIHADRMRLKKTKLLAYEGDCGVNDNDVALQSDVGESDHDTLEQDSSVRSIRVRQPPVWPQNYVKVLGSI